ncbi:hypothetical protein [Klebsiella quasipneumoniae]|uniref:hypothetical protein n=1 Tax=Klebsiella quasipneumoniae TaxID=1463165 RepID=UPI0021D931FC|nr:hypothetical protein [Klebsiella quasipneumoniae]MCU8818942.1 hypothetical protein [Klebsiella quasipneumoniae]
MAKPETIYDNARLHKELNNRSYTSLSSEARKAITDTIQGCKFLGMYKLPEKDVFYLVRDCFEISKKLTEHHLNMNRIKNKEKAIHGESSIEKYKRVATLVAIELEKLLDNGDSLCFFAKHRVSKGMTEEQEQHYLQMSVDKLSIKERIAYLQSLLK